jgi:hypothetical protein
MQRVKAVAARRRRLTVVISVVLVALVVNFIVVAITGSANGSPHHGSTLRTDLALVLKSKADLDDFSETLSGHVLFQRHAGQLVPLASTMKILILDEAASEIAAGQLQAQQMIRLSAIASTYLPGTDGGAHAAALATARSRGWVTDGRVSFLHVLYMMIWFSDNAATDTVMRIINDRQLDILARRLGQDPPLPPDGVFASWTTQPGIPENPHRGAAYDREVLALALKLHRDASFRQTVDADVLHQVTIQDQAHLVPRTFPRGSAKAYVQLMAQIVSGRTAADRIARPVLEWPLLAYPTEKHDFALIAQKGGDLEGVLTVVEALRLPGKHQSTYITALFFHGISDRASEAIQSADAFDGVPIGIATSTRFRREAARKLQ